MLPAAIVAGWLMMLAGVFASVESGPAVHGSIETVLTASTAARSPVAVTFAQR